MRRHIKPIRVNPRSVKSRDNLMVALINGATKAGTFRDNRKHTNKYAAREKTMPAAVLAHIPDCDVAVDWERDTDLYRVYANVTGDEVDIIEIHLLDDVLQTAAVINTAMFTAGEWHLMESAVLNEWERMNEES